MRSSFVALWRPALRLAGYRRRLVVASFAMCGRVALSLVIPYLLGAAVEKLHAGDGEGAKHFGRLLFAACLALFVVHVTSRSLFEKASRVAIDELRLTLFDRLLARDPRRNEERQIGDATSLFAADTVKLRVLWGTGVGVFLHTTLTIAFAVSLMISLSDGLTLAALAPYPFTLVVFAAASPKYFKVSRAAQDQLGKLTAFVGEELAGIQIIKSYCLEEKNNERFSELAARYLKRRLELVRVEGRVGPVVNSLQALSMAIALVAGGKMAVEGSLTIGELTTFISYLALLAGPLGGLGFLVPSIQDGRAAWSRIEPALENAPRSIAPVPAMSLSAPPHVELREVTVKSGDRVVIDRATFSVPAGSTCALVGATGSGKSTILDLLIGFVEAPKNSAFLGGIDLTTIPRDVLRRTISYAHQDAFLFSTTIEENIAIGIRSELDAQARKALIARVAELAGLGAELRELPDGLATVIGERGVTLSGGQRQRVALARTLASDAQIVLLDDPLSAVDAEKEAEIVANILDYLRGRTIIFASHRLETMKQMDQIVVLHQGLIAEVGAHEALRGQRGVYEKLYAEYMFSLLGVRA